MGVLVTVVRVSLVRSTHKNHTNIKMSHDFGKEIGRILRSETN